MNINDIRKTVCLHYKPAKDRLVFVNTLRSILKTNFEIDLNIHESIPLPHFEKITNYHRLNIANPNLININDTFYDKVNVFNCSLNWYVIIKQLQELSKFGGYFLLFEDDVVIKDLDLFKDLLEKVPNDVNILRISCDNIDYDYVMDYNQLFYKQIVRPSYTNWRGGSTACFVLDKRGIDHCCNFIETNGYFPADHMLMNISEDLNVYIAKTCPVSNESFIGNIGSHI